MINLFVVCFAISLGTLGCSAANHVADVQPMQAQEQNITPFLFEYSFSETPQNPGGGADPKKKFIKVGLKGEFTAREMYPVGSYVGYSYSKSGMLTQRQLTRIQQIIERLDLPSIQYSEVYLSRGGIEFGWSGYLTYMENGNTYHINFSSQHSPQQMLDEKLKARFFALIRDMDDFFLSEIKD